MSSLNLKTVLALLKSDKSKDRQQGIATLREVFSRDSRIEKLDEDGDGRVWLAVFQALFAAVSNERASVVKKGNAVAAAERRLKDTASTLRWLVEVSVRQWATKVSKPLVNHLLQTMVSGRSLFTPVALDYVKALRVICSYAPHLNYIMTEESQWIRILSLSFAVVLGDDLKMDLEVESEGMSEAEVSSALSAEEMMPSRKRKKHDVSGRKSSKHLPPRTASPEQIEFVALIAILLRSPRVRLMSPEHPRLPGAVLERLYRFFKLFPVETSAHLDAIVAVEAALNSIALNARNEVSEFGVKIWDHLLLLWSTKSRQMKEGVLIALKMLFPYVKHAEADFDRVDGVGKLVRHLQTDHETRWGFDELSLDALRLEIVTDQADEPFIARTFRAGFNFSAGQATAWVVLELLADATKEFYLLSESNHSLAPGPSRSEGKRMRLENPIKSMLQSIQNPRLRGKTFYLQSLLFIIDRHWSVLHSEVQLEMINALHQLITADDANVQSWVFCCFAAIAYADCLLRSPSLDSVHWDGIWSHTMRRTNAPVISRAACHAANALLLCEKLPVTRILAEIEAMTQDINVQGPAAPYDAVCAFLTRCVKVASQDARLYRMRLDDKVLSWLMENWNVLNGVSRSATALASLRMEQHTVRDLLALLESACGLSESGQLLCSIQLPQHPVVDLLQSEMDTEIIRGFLLDACFPVSQRTLQSNGSPKGLSTIQSADLAQPNARVRKASAFLLKTLETVLPSWENPVENVLRPPVESVRRALDLAVLAICFESSLVVNRIRNNRRTLLAACKIITVLTPFLLNSGWSTEELAIIVSSFTPLTSDFIEDGSSSDKWEAFVVPGKATGVKSKPLERWTSKTLNKSRRDSKKCLQSTIWQSADVQDALAAVLDSLKRTLRMILVRQRQTLDKHPSPLVDDDKDDFGPIRTTNTPTADISRTLDDRSAVKRVVGICINIIALAPVLKLPEGEESRDRSLIDLVCDCSDDDNFQVVLEPFLWHVQQHNVHLTLSSLDRLLERIERPLVAYQYSRSDALHISAIHLLDATSHVWLQKSTSSLAVETADKVRALGQWLATNLKEGRLLCWRTRDALARFYDHYLSLDPSQGFLATPTEDMAEEKRTPIPPDALLPVFSKDEDIRVRFTAALCSARLFSSAYISDKDPLNVYTDIRSQLCLALSNYEHMLTRLLCLTNIIISSSAVRRGPYWHLLETCLYSQSYIDHIGNLLNTAAERMGFEHLSELFEAYASQIAYSVRQSSQDFFQIPPHLLGYRDREECAEATFEAFSPTNLLATAQDAEDFAHGQGPFAHHCVMVNKKPVDGLLRCFADIVGYFITFWLGDTHMPGHESMDTGAGNISVDASGLSADLHARFISLGSPEFVQNLIEQNVDGIVCAILRTGSDLDYHREGPIVKALERLDKSERSVRAFRALMKFRGQSEFEMHSPNLPAYSTSTVLMALYWLIGQVSTTSSPATTYHVLQYFFANISRCPLINEQLRLVTCLCIWVSLVYSHFKNSTLLRVLMSGAAALLDQLDLTAIAQGMLEWAFIHLRDTQCDTPYIVGILIRICTISKSFVCSDDEITKSTGVRLKKWLESQILLLGEVASLRKRIAVALAAWPDELGDYLSGMKGELSCEELSNILDDPYLSSHKFKVARRLSAFASELNYEEEFAKHDFWRLKDSIPKSSMLDEEVDAFTALLIANSGHIRSQVVDQSYGRSIGSRYLKLTMQRDDKMRRNHNASIKRPIVNALLDMLTEQSAEVIHVAYRTLRLLAGIESLDSLDYGNWPSEYRDDVSFLSFCPTRGKSGSQESLTDLLQPSLFDAASNFSNWISEMTVFLAGVLSAQDPFYGPLFNVLQNNAHFAEDMFPVLVHTLLRNDTAGSESRTILSEFFSRLLLQDEIDVRCHRSVVNLILHLRQFDPMNQQDVLAYNRWLDLDFMLLSRSAIICGAYTTALLFLELAPDSRPLQKADDKSSEQILFDIYSHIDEPDGFYGIKTDDLQNFLLRRFHHERQWDKAFQFHGAAYEAGDSELRGPTGILESLHSFGFNKLAISTLQSLGDGPSASQSSEMEYRLGWRTGTWDLPNPVNYESSGSTLYVALRAIHRGRDTEVIDGIISKSLSDELQRLRSLGNENLAEIRQVTQSLMCLAQIRRWRSKEIQDSLSASIIDIDEKQWVNFCFTQPNFDFPDLESIVATRISLLRSARLKDQRDQIGSMQSDLTRALIRLEKGCLVQLSEAAREANQTQIALNSVVCASRLEDVSTFKVNQEFANVLWLQHEQKFAIECLKGEMQRQKWNASHSADNSNKVEEALIMAKLGEWTSEACLEKPDFIHANFFSPAIDLLLRRKDDNGSLGDARAVVFYKCALFAEQQYHAIVRSPDIIRLKVYKERKEQELRDRGDTLRKTSSTSSKWQELTQYQKKAKALLAQDTAQFVEVTSSRDKYLHQAIQMLSLCLEASDSYDGDATIRMCSLWFANFGTEELNTIIPAAVSKVPSRKFVFLSHQLSARLSSSESPKTSNQKALQSLLLRMCSEHPFHSLYQVYSLQSSNTGAGSSLRRRSSATEPESVSQIDRATAASSLFDRLSSSDCANKARDVRALCDAYLEWAKYPIKNDPALTEKRRKKEALQVPKHLAIRKVSSLRVPVTTADTPLDPSMRYEHCVWIHGYSSNFDTAGGINLPKINYCMGSDGVKYKQLFKGEGDDDLRQDAVMEQVFELCNQVLSRDRETRKRKLSIRSYKVVPLAPQAGLLEFVGNTWPMNNWLITAHARYHPKDLGVRDCSAQMATLRKETRTDRLKPALVTLFKQIRENFHPVMRHFFTERHKMPQNWFEMRLRYSRSVAVTSIVGHILGLGDRHISNILLDTASGEVVHIDLGIAFEQGKLLTVPERVPFRLTADMVDGFGMSGTEGVFRRCAEETLRVLREGSDVIKTVLEVFKYDPLHSWTASAVKIQKAQGADSGPSHGLESERFGMGVGIGIDMSSGVEDEAADRALSGVARKLDKALSVEYTVNELIAEATDVENLAMMFSGWSPFC